ncbi:MAG: LysR family transcriptional regulator substrate-binding protein, partial [Lachnospiraceae bacterium]|nr:LysR family transcriptional regulator substrate-binding protein [Lachnospiraceae bacterium]
EWNDVIHALHNSYIRASSIQSREQQQLRIGILNTARPELYLWKIEEHFVKTYPDIKLIYGSTYMTDLEEELAKGNYDLIMIPDFERFIVESMNFCWKWAACSHANVIMSKSHPLAKHSSLKMADILYESFATLEKRDRQTHREDLEGRMAPYHVKPPIVPGYQNAYEIKYLFRKQENAMIFIDEYFDCPDSPDLVKIPVVDEKNGIICAWNPYNQKPQVQKFIEVLRPAQK